jgi:small-conductance mechanosensitive channel
MTNSDDLHFERAQARISKAMFAISAGGIIAAWAWRGWTFGAGFALGATASWLNYRWLKQVVDALGDTRPTRKRVAVLAGLRYLLLGGGAYAILHYSPVSVGAALTGLFAAVAAVIVEILFELVYART